jgi:hypothetical protein
MNAQLSPYHAHDAALIAARDWEPTDAQIADRAAYLLPLIQKHHPEPEEMLSEALANPRMNRQHLTAIRAAITARDEPEIGRLMLAVFDPAAAGLAEDIASDELYRADMLPWMATTHAALRAGDVFEWLREKSL